MSSLESRKSTALHDPGAELLDRIAAGWARYSRIALGVVGAVVVVTGVAFYTVRQGATQDNQASKGLSQAQLLYWQGDYDRAKTTAQEISKAYGGTASGVDAHRVAGDASFWRSNWKDAISEYQAYLSRSGKGIVAESVRRSLAYAYESNQQYAEAAKLYDGLVGVFERESSGEMLAASARCLEASGNGAEATKRLQRLVDEYGDTSVAIRARVKLAELAAAAH